MIEEEQEKEEFFLRCEISGRKRKLNILNRYRLTNYELDEIFLEGCL